MFTPEGKAGTPSSISKYLTPCRRLGLSRPNKPKENITPGPLTPESNLENDTPNADKSATKAKITPYRRLGLSRPSKLLKCTPTTPPNEVKSEDSKCLSSVNKHFVPPFRRIGLSKKTPNSAPSKVQTLQKEKQTLNPSLTPKNLREVEYEVTPTKFTQEENLSIPETKENGIIDSPSKPPVISTVTAQVHHPMAKRQISFDSAVAVEAPKNSIPLQIENTGSPKSFKQTKKRLRNDLDSEAEDGRLKLTSEDNKLARFTTEEYLQEYSKNPEAFKKELSVSNDLDDFKLVKFYDKKVKIDSKRDNKDYIAVLMNHSKSLSAETINPRPQTLGKSLVVSLERVNTTSSTLTEGKTIASKLSCGYNSDDDEAFTSSPDNDKKQRENLLKLISNVEKEVKLKKETLERLKQAQVYKKMHSPKELKALSGIWIQGCRSGLKDLHKKICDHQPMEIDVLIRKLNISRDIVVKLNLV